MTVLASSENHDDQQGRKDLQHFFEIFVLKPDFIVSVLLRSEFFPSSLSAGCKKPQLEKDLDRNPPYSYFRPRLDDKDVSVFVNLFLVPT